MNFDDIDIKALIDIFPNNTYMFDLNNRLVWVNKIQMEALGLPNRDNLQSITFQNLMTIFDWDEEMLQIISGNNRKVIDMNQSINFEEEGLFKGKRHYFLTTKNPYYDRKGNIIGVIGHSFDITERNENMRLLQEKHQLSQTLQSLHILAAAMAHELRTPLLGAKSGVEVLEKQMKRFFAEHPDIDSLSAEKLLTVLSTMKIQLNQSLMFVDLSFANFNVNKIDKTTFSILSMKSAIKQGLMHYPFLATERELVHWDEETSEDFMFLGQSSLTRHVLYNLLRNAIYYARTVRKGLVILKIENDKNGHRLIIKDTGRGIEPDILPKIFDLFFTAREMGTGTGLSFCKTVMQEYGGEIVCDSVLGKYTQFTLIFPAIDNNS